MPTSVDGAGQHTTTGGVVTGLLAHESRVLHCGHVSHRFHDAAKLPECVRERQNIACGILDVPWRAIASRTSQCLCFSLRSLCQLGLGRRTLSAEELAGDVKSLAAHNDDLLAVE
jgi:hypothetical protein